MVCGRGKARVRAGNSNFAAGQTKYYAETPSWRCRGDQSLELSNYTAVAKARTGTCGRVHGRQSSSEPNAAKPHSSLRVPDRSWATARCGEFSHRSGSRDGG